MLAPHAWLSLTEAALPPPAPDIPALLAATIVRFPWPGVNRHRGVRRISSLGELGGAVDHKPPAKLSTLADLHSLPYAAEGQELLFAFEQPRSLPPTSSYARQLVTDLRNALLAV